MRSRHVSTVDQGFVPATAAVCYGRLADPAGYPAWWPGAAVRDAPGGTAIEIGGLRMEGVRPDGVRPGVGLYLRFDGRGGAGSLEWYLEPFDGGTIVSAIAELDPRRPWGRRRVLRFRAAIRDGLVGLRAFAEANA